VVIATWWETAFMVMCYPPEKGRKFYFIQHHEVHDHLPRHLSAGSYFLPLKKITISSWLVETMRDVYGDDDVEMIHNSVDCDLFSAPPRGRQTRPTVGLLYTSNPFKGMDIALRAIEIAKKRHPDLRVVTFGKRKPSEHLPLPEGTLFRSSPPQHEIRDLYASCDVWLCGSRAEGFHLPPLEAMACRCPVVSTRVGGPRDIVENGKNGFLVDVEDAEALGKRLNQVLSFSEADWLAMSDAALQTARGYTWQDATDLFERALLTESDK
jgi:glycosyltransferase involved in cell wall biosynthesis